MSYFSTAAFFFLSSHHPKVFLSKSFWHLSKLDYGTGAEVNSSKQFKNKMKKRQWDNILYNVNFLQLSYKKIRWSQLEKSWLASPGELQN